MIALTRIAIEQWRLTAALIVLVIVAGTFTYLHQSSQEDPEITIRTAVVTAQFPGMSARQVEQLLTKPIEEAARQIPAVATLESASQTGLATVKVEVGPQYDDVRRIWAKLREKMDDLAPALPVGTVGPRVNDDYGRVATTTLALHGEDFSFAELRAVARWLRDRLGVLPLVSRIDLYGVQDERIWLEFDRVRLAQLGLSADTVLRTIAEQNRILSSGSLETEEGLRYMLAPSGRFEDYRAIGDVPIATPTGALVYARDILRIERGYVDPPENPVFFAGQPAVTLAVSMVENAAIQSFGAQLEGRLAQLRNELPLGMSLDIVTHQPPIVAASISEATQNLVETMATVLAVVVVFLGIRAGLTVGTIVPLTIFMSLVGMLVWGIPLHRISIAAIIIALGLLVDNGVVIAEDIKARLDEGADRMSAALEASRTLAVPLLTSSLTTILAFLPLMLAQDTTGEFLRALSQVIIITLLSSWLLSITVTPVLCYFFVAPSGRGSESFLSRHAIDGYRRALRLILGYKLAFLLATVAVFLLAMFGMARVPSGLLPPSERAQFVVNLEVPAGTVEGETAQVARRLARFLGDRDRNPEITGSVVYVGNGGPRFFLALAPLDPAPHVAFAVVNAVTPADVRPLRRRVERYIAEQIPEGRGRTELLFLGSEPPGTVQIRVKGDDVDALYHAGQHVIGLFSEVEGTRDLRTDWANPVLQINVLIDQARARRSGLVPSEIARSLQATFAGAQVTDYREGDASIPVVLRAQPDDRATLDDLAEMTVLAGSVPIPLLQVAALGGELQPWVIRRYDQERAITISGARPGMQAAELLSELAPKLDALPLPAGFTWEPDGEVEASRKANAALFQFMPHCLAAIVLLLIWQFNSLRRVAIIVATIPLVMIGVSLGLNTMRAVFDFNAMLGVFSLAGIIVNNGIVLIERIDAERRVEASVHRALLVACSARLRPIMMATLTTILGLLPLHFFGGELWYSMTIVMMFGLGVGTVLTLAAVPVLYATLFPENHGASATGRAPRPDRPASARASEKREPATAVL